MLADLANSVVAVEEEPSLAALARTALAAYANVELVEGPLAAGHAAEGPYDLIVVDGAAEELPARCSASSKTGGRVVTGLLDRGVTRLAAGRRTEGLRPRRISPISNVQFFLVSSAYEPFNSDLKEAHANFLSVPRRQLGRDRRACRRARPRRRRAGTDMPVQMVGTGAPAQAAQPTTTLRDALVLAYNTNPGLQSERANQRANDENAADRAVVGPSGVNGTGSLSDSIYNSDALAGPLAGPTSDRPPGPQSFGADLFRAVGCAIRSVRRRRASMPAMPACVVSRHSSSPMR